MAQNNSLNNKSSTLTVDNGLTVTTGASTINTGIGSLAISNDASATTVNIATGAAAKTVTLGSTNTTSKLDLKYGTADFSIASATGMVMSILDTGEMTMPLQPTFYAEKNTEQTDVTGDGTAVTVIYELEKYDIGSHYNNATGVFTAPVTGTYLFRASAYFSGILNTHLKGELYFTSTAATVFGFSYSPYSFMNSDGRVTISSTALIKMTAGDTCYVVLNVYGGTKVIDIRNNYLSSFSGCLIC
jgi:hypothetical protein